MGSNSVEGDYSYPEEELQMAASQQEPGPRPRPVRGRSGQSGVRLLPLRLGQDLRRILQIIFFFYRCSDVFIQEEIFIIFCLVNVNFSISAVLKYKYYFE